MWLGGWWALCTLLACGDTSGSSRDAAPLGRARGAVVATVNGSAIGSDDVRALAEQLGLPAREALTRLEEAALAEQHASAQGYGARADVVQEGRRAMVRALLAATVEQEVRPELIPLELVRARFEAGRAALGVAVDAFPQHEQAIREQLTTEQRKAALEKLLTKLRGQIGVQLDEVAAQKQLSDPAVWSGGS